MQPACGGWISDRFADSHGEGDDVVLDAGFDLMDLRHIDFGASANRGGGILRDLAGFGQCLGGCQLNFQPLCKLVRVTPNVAHLLTRVTWDQFLLLKRRRKKTRVLLCISIVHDTAETAGLFLTEPSYLVRPGGACRGERPGKLLAPKNVHRHLPRVSNST